jgi:uncharacterized protein involved in exopolysaccharide biosynthesis
MVLESEQKRRRIAESELEQKQTEWEKAKFNYENRKQVGDKIIQQLKKEVQELRIERNQIKQELQAKNKRIQELMEQMEVTEKLTESELTSQVEFPPKD